MIDLFRPFMSPGVAANLARVVAPDDKGRIFVGEGPRTAEFEQRFTGFVGAPRDVLAVNSCTSALDLALYLAGVLPDDEVISTPMTCTATNSVIVNRGARIVWADVDPMTGLIDPFDVLHKITDRTRAIMAVDWAGRSCDYRSLRSNGLPVIQDAAHNLAVDMTNRGDYTCWSFQAIKHLTTGDGGAILCPADQVERARLLRWYGLDRRSSADYRCDQDIAEAGFKYHMNDIAASIGLANLPYAADQLAQARQNAAWYEEYLRGVPGITRPYPDRTSAWWLYCLLVDDRDSFRAHLADHLIATSPVHKRNDVHPAYSFPNGSLPGVDFFDSHQVAIPVGSWVTESDRIWIASSIHEWARERTRVAA